jgi:phosphatidylglycerol:prolipoprotein diacylglycerol transferase
MILAIPYPDFNPVAFTIFTLPIRWYALAYITGLVLGWRYCAYLIRRAPIVLTTEALDDLLVWVTFGVVLGGRVGYVLFYRPGYYVQNLAEIPAVWHGGMSFHGGCAGVILALALFARKNRLSLLAIGDIVVSAVPIGLFFGRLANFVNGELFGRPTDVPWAMVFPGAGPEPRHPSQLYQATLEGLVLFVVLFILERSGARHRRGVQTGVFLMGYAIARTIGELFRQPDPQLGFLLFGVTMGQLLSLPMLLSGAWLIWRAKPQPQTA